MAIHCAVAEHGGLIKNKSSWVKLRRPSRLTLGSLTILTIALVYCLPCQQRHILQSTDCEREHTIVIQAYRIEPAPHKLEFSYTPYTQIRTKHTFILTLLTV